MKILHINYSKDRGGAAKACLRIHRALIDRNVDSQMLTALMQGTDEANITCYSNTIFKQIIRKIKKIFNLSIVMLFQKSNNKELHTFDIGNVVSPDYINNSDADIVHLHWISYSMIGIKQLKKIKKPIVWTFHDMWPFMGCEHYDDLKNPDRYKTSYTKHNKNVKGIDINRIAWKLKRKYWESIDFQIITPSNWLKNCAKKSVLFKNANISVIPNVIEENVFRKKDKKEIKKKLSLSEKTKYILFGAFNTKNYNKGGDLLYEAINNLKIDNVELLVFGADSSDIQLNIPTTYLGYIKDESNLNDLYNAADVFVVPSRQDNLPNTVLESICSGTPVVGFKIGGLPDMIIHKKNGYLAEPFDTNDLRMGIEYVLTNPNKENFTENCNRHFKQNFSKEVIIPKIIDYYKQAIDKKQKTIH